VELFTIECTTCRARLKVNDDSVLGEILACPKCGSMVQVVPPLGWSKSVTATVAPADLIKPAAPPKQVGKAAPSSTSSARQAPSGSKSGIVPAKKVASSRPIKPPPIPSSTSVGPPAASQPNETAAGPAPIPPPRMAAPQHGTRSGGQWRMLAAALASGVVLGTIFWVFLVWQAPPGDQVGGRDQATATAAVEDVAASEPSSQSKTPGPAEIDEEIAAPAGGPWEEKSSAPADPVASAEELAPSSDATPSPPASADAAKATAPSPVLKIDRPPAATAAAGNQPATSQPSAIPAELGQEPQRPAVRIPDHADADDLDGSPAPRFTAREIDEHLARKLPRIEFSKTPLVKFLDFVAEFTGVPVRIDPDALVKLSEGRRTAVSVNLSDATAAELLERALAKLGLVYVVRDGQVVVTSGK